MWDGFFFTFTKIKSMILLKPYEGLEDVLIHIKQQVIDSIEYAENYCPRFSNPESLFYWLKDRTTYLSDPTTIELIMTMETMMTGSRTGVPGAGDCDDFTITGLACLIAQGWTINQVVLVGHRKDSPVHIYCRTCYDSQWFIFDLTNDNFDEERHYGYYQELNFVI